jgi:cell division protein FtsB
LIQNIIELEAEVSKLNEENEQLKEQNNQYIAQIETKK